MTTRPYYFTHIGHYFKFRCYGSSCTLTKYTGQGGHVVIPQTVNGLRVITIEKQAFYRCKALTRVTFAKGSTLQSIRLEAFRDCCRLTNITFPNVTYIGKGAFHGCDLTSVTIPNEAKIGDCAFRDCYRLTSVTIPNSVTELSTIPFA